jgi:hypothetical protein
VSKDDIRIDRKRVNLCFSIKEFDNLALAAEFEKQSVSNYCYVLVMKDVATKAAAIRKSGYVPEAQRGENIFQKKKGK